MQFLKKGIDMNNSTFIGRKAELALLNDLFAKKTSSLVVIKGRRRIGKSRLVEEFAKKFWRQCFIRVSHRAHLVRIH